MRILLVEDHRPNAELIQRCLAEIGHGVVHATCALDGLKLARLTCSDLYLIDLDLPDLSGLQLGLALGRLMQHDVIYPAPIAAVTAQFDIATQSQAQQFGFRGFLGKPFGQAELIAFVKHFDSDST
jgi:CheY-like chemotaxis protein